MNQTKSRLELGQDSKAANARLGALLNRQRTNDGWDADDDAELEAARLAYHQAQTAITHEMILPMLDAYKRPPCLVRPGTLPIEDNRLAKDLKDAKKIVATKHHNAKETRKAKHDLGAWADHLRKVRNAEAEGSSRVKTLLRYLSHAEGCNDVEVVETLRGFLTRNWGWGGDIIVSTDLDAVAVELSRRRDIISDKLMYGEQPSTKVDDGPQQGCISEVV